MKPLENVEKELLQIRSLGTNKIFFTDDNFIANISYTKELLELLKEYDFSWICQVSTNIYQHEDLIAKMSKVGCSAVYMGIETFSEENLENIVVLENIISDKLKIQEEALKGYLTDLYQADIVGKEDIKQLYEITSNQIFSTPYIVNRSLPKIHERLDVADPFIVVDIGGATTDIHYSRDLVNDNILTESGYDRLVFKKLGVFKSRESLVHTAKNNEFVFELLEHLNVTENILEEQSETATRVLMQLAIFLVLYKVSKHHGDYVELNLDILNSIVLTGGITKVLTQEDVDDIVLFFYKKILHFHHAPTILLDSDYEIWTYGIKE